MNSAIQYWTHQVVHGRIDDDESFPTILFHVDDSGQQNARWPNDCSTRFQQQMQTERPHHFRHHSCIYFARRWPLRGVTHAKSTTDIEVFQHNAVATQFANISCKPRESPAERIEFHNLRSNMNTDPVPTDPL